MFLSPQDAPGRPKRKEPRDKKAGRRGKNSPLVAGGDAGAFVVADGSAAAERAANPFTYRGPDAAPDRAQRLHQAFKSLPKEERQRLVEAEAAHTDLLARTVHLRFLPTGMQQGELAALCAECGEYLRVRICGNSANAQNWIYGFVEFADRSGAENMLRRSGMELSNGPGKPPLRLRCNGAKQAIVDRIFHDANPATNMPCIFGSGNFAHRTLKEAVDSYYNLKRKEIGAMLSCADASAALRMNCTKNTNSNSNSSRNNKGTSPSQTPQQYATQQDDCLLPLFCPVSASFYSHSTSHSDGESANATPHFQFPGASGSNTFKCDSGLSAPPNLWCVSEVSHNHLLSTCGGDDTALHKEPLSRQQVALPFTLMPQGLFTELPSLLFSRTHTLVRGKALILQAMRCAQQFVTTGEQFYDAIGSIRTLLKVIEEHNTHASGLNAASRAKAAVESYEKKEDGEEAAMQRITQLRLLAYLLLSLLYALKKNDEECLVAVNKAVNYCGTIPLKRLQKPTSSPALVSSAVARRHSVSESLFANVKNDEVSALSSCSEEFSCEGPSCLFNPLSQAFNIFGHADVIAEAEQEAAVVGAAMGVLPPDEQDSFLTESCVLQEENFSSDVQFQSYVINVLLTVGLAMELVHPVVTRCVYTHACFRAREVFGSAMPELERALQAGDGHRLRPVLFPDVADVDFAKTFFGSFDLNAAFCDDVFWAALPPGHMVRCFPLV